MQLQVIVEERESYSQSDRTSVLRNRLSKISGISGEMKVGVGPPPQLVHSKFSGEPALIRVESSAASSKKESVPPLESGASRLEYSKSIDVSSNQPLTSSTEGLILTNQHETEKQQSQPKQPVTSQQYNVVEFQPESPVQSHGCCLCWQTQPSADQSLPLV